MRLVVPIAFVAFAALAAPEESGEPTPPLAASPTPETSATPVPSETPAATAAPSATPAATATAIPTPEPTATPAPTPVPSPTPRPIGVGSPILFRGECTPGGGPTGCRVVAVGVVAKDAIGPIPCDSETVTRDLIAARYFASGTPLDLYVRGAPAGTFIVADEDEPPRGCSNRAKGRKVSAQGKVLSFVALDPEDPVKLGPLKFPAGVQPDARSVVVASLKEEPFGASASEIGVHEVRRLKEGEASVIVAEVTTSNARSVIIAEGNGSDPAGWKRVWHSDPKTDSLLVDALDLGADGKTEILVETLHRGEPSGWILLRREGTEWKPVTP